MSKIELPKKLKRAFAMAGRKGGLSGSHENKVKAGKASGEARRKKRAAASNNNHTI